MRALFKALLKASGTPVLQTLEGGVETILSAGNIWTSAHARRIALAERGVAPGAVLCSQVGGFQAVIDFVACAIGGFVYLPVTPARSKALRQHLAAAPIANAAGIVFVGEEGGADHHPLALPAALAAIPAVPGAQLAFYRDAACPLTEVSVLSGERIAALLAELSARFATPEGGTRLTCGAEHHGPGFVTDLLLGLCNRQTIHLRAPARGEGLAILREAIDLAADDLVLAPALLDDLAQDIATLGAADRGQLRSTRLHTGGRALSAHQAGIAAAVFGAVLVETLAFGEDRQPPAQTPAPLPPGLPQPAPRRTPTAAA